MTTAETPNPVVKTTPLSAYPWLVREYRDGTFDAAQLNGPGLTIGVGSFREAVAEIRRLTVR